MTRAMLVTVLYRLEGEPTVTGRSSFTDVRSGAYYEKSVIWAAANGIVTGTDSTSFSPRRQGHARTACRDPVPLCAVQEAGHRCGAKLDSFSDAGSVSGYASEALGWAVSEGLINGASGRLMPKGRRTRAQVAADPRLAAGATCLGRSSFQEEARALLTFLQQVCRENKLHLEFSDAGLRLGFIEGIGNLYEFDCGAESGWMYAVNGWFPNYGCSQYALQDGDTVTWVYTCELGRDVSSGGWTEGE